MDSWLKTLNKELLSESFLNNLYQNKLFYVFRTLEVVTCCFIIAGVIKHWEPNKIPIQIVCSK